MNFKLLILSLSFLALYSCKSEYDFTIESPKKIQINQKGAFSVKEKNNQPIDSIIFSIDTDIIGKGIQVNNVNLDKYTLGKHELSALIFYQNKSEKITTQLYLLGDKTPKVYTYEIINTYPHDKEAYTQGLEYFNGFLYEGTGKKGASSIRKVALESGEILQKIDIDNEYFGEGISIINNQIHQLTWQNGIGFVYDLNTFEKIKDFKYKKSREGWGLTNNGINLIKSDGTERIWFLNPTTHEEEHYIEAYTNKRKVENLNELEFINGFIYSNVWQQNSIIIINPKNGQVEGVADLNGLKKEVEKEQNLDSTDDVLNGIAYDKENDRIFVTGKHWGKLFEIKLIEK